MLVAVAAPFIAGQRARVALMARGLAAPPVGLLCFAGLIALVLFGGLLALGALLGKSGGF